MKNELARIQKELKAPKNQRNSFGNYNYRSCEDILEALKPILGDSTLVISDEIVAMEGRFYVKATATLTTANGNYTATAYAREAETKKGMDEAQITGSASSYARKYALNGLFLIDDSKDPDTDEYSKDPIMKATQYQKPKASTQACPSCHAPAGKPHANNCTSTS